MELTADSATSIVSAIQEIFAFFDSLNITATGWIVASVVFALALLFAVREAVSWFLKTDDLKRDLKRVRRALTELEGELKVVQNLLENQILRDKKTDTSKRSSTATVPPPASIETAPLKKSEEPKKSGGFTISH